MVGEGIYKITLKRLIVWGWSVMKWTEKKTGRGWGLKGVMEGGRERERGPQAIDGEVGRGEKKKTRRSKREREGEREGGRSVWAEAC